ncbi:hypothetical protein NQ318_003864, partial [Aromia moschata]
MIVQKVETAAFRRGFPESPAAIRFLLRSSDGAARETAARPWRTITRSYSWRAVQSARACRITARWRINRGRPLDAIGSSRPAASHLTGTVITRVRASAECTRTV